MKSSKYPLPAMVDAAAVRAAKAAVPEGDVLREAVEVYKALASPVRVRILHALAHDELSVGDLAHALELPLSSVSHQLALLRRLRLVSGRDQGRLTFYRVIDDVVGHLVHDALALVAARVPGTRRHHHGPLRGRR